MNIDPTVFRVIHHKSKSFSLAQKLLPKRTRAPAAAVYAWCRRADDAIDEASEPEARIALVRLERELDELYDGAQVTDPVLRAFQQVVTRYGIPQQYPRDLLLGMRMDVTRRGYQTLGDLHLYCYRVAGTVGLMMCHVLGVRSPSGLRHAAHLGMAMQLTNICRDVMEDWQRGRLYVPRSLLPRDVEPPETPYPFPADHGPAFAVAVRSLLAEADRLYASGDQGLCYLPPRSAWAIAVARLVYSNIGSVLRARQHDVTQGRAYVPHAKKVWLVLQALYESLAGLPRRWRARAPDTPLSTSLRYPSDVLPL